MARLAALESKHPCSSADEAQLPFLAGLGADAGVEQPPALHLACTLHTTLDNHQFFSFRVELHAIPVLLLVKVPKIELEHVNYLSL